MTRRATVAAASARTEAAAATLLGMQCDAAVGNGLEHSAPAATSPPADVASLTTETIDSAPPDSPSKQTGLRALSHAENWTALRIAMAARGDPSVQPPSPVRSWLADRYIHQRVRVDQHTAAAVLYECYSQSRVLVLRDFPGAFPPAHSSVSEVLHQPPPEATRRYAFNSHGSRVHYILRTPTADAANSQPVRDWWANVNLLPDRGTAADPSSGVLWSFLSRRARTLLHVDEADGVATQWRGKKLWVLVRAEEAEEQHIVPIDLDAMRDPLPQLHRLTAWQACASFQWCILEEGDTLVTPRDRLHAVCCIGDQDAVSSGVYCWLAGTPPLAEDESAPKPSRKRRRLSSPATPAPAEATTLLPVAAKAWEVAPSSHPPGAIRVVVATLIDVGLSLADAASRSGVSVSTVQRWSKRLHETGSAKDASRIGRPRATDEYQDAAIIRAAEIDHFESNHAIRNELALAVCDDTVGRRLDAAGLTSHVAATKRHYTDEQRRARLSFARGYAGWTAEQWEHVIFSDEVTIEGAGRKRHQRVRRPEGHRFDPEYTVHSRIYAPSRHLFACFCSRGPGFCEMYEGKLDGKALRRLLDNTVVQTAADYYDLDHGEQWYFVHDNSPPFKSREVQRWVHNRGITVLDFPPYSPDLNPIENMWPRIHELTDKEHPTTDEALADAFIKCWPEISLDIFTNYAQSMPARIAAVIEANGDATKY